MRGGKSSVNVRKTKKLEKNEIKLAFLEKIDKIAVSSARV